MAFPVRLTLVSTPPGANQPLWLFRKPETVRLSTDGSSTIVTMPSGETYAVMEAVSAVLELFQPVP